MHDIVPKHELLTPEEKEKLFGELKLVPANLPKIYSSDPALALFGIKANLGDVIKITRAESTCTALHYRIVIE